MLFRHCVFACLFCSFLTAATPEVSRLSDEYWAWRSIEQPFTLDDIPRIERPAAFSVDWAPATVRQRRADVAAFERRWKALAPSASEAIADKVDYRLLGSAIARAHFELEIEQSWLRNPSFYVDQTLGSVFVLLLQPAPFDTARQDAIVARMKKIPGTLASARQNLTAMREPFGRLAIEALDKVPERWQATFNALSAELDESHRQALSAASVPAIEALVTYRDWLEKRLPGTRKDTAIGRANYVYFLRNVALMPYSPEDLLNMSRQEWSRTVAFEAYEQGRNAGVAPVPMFASQEEQMKAEKTAEGRVREYMVAQKILSVPDWLKHYHNLPLPSYLQHFHSLGVTDDLTSATRLGEDGISYIRPPSSDLGFFSVATAHDPRPILLHEGVPGHYYQLCLSWANPDPIRRRYYDSGSNEGIGFYAEEMMLQAGYMDDSPHTRETIYSFMRLRALRVEVDVKLALGEFSLRQAADYLTRTVPMDPGTALGEAAMFAATPGQAISYQIGKIQIMNLLADARRTQGDQFRLQAFHDFIWLNGNVPFSLQRWELLKDPSEVPRNP